MSEVAIPIPTTDPRPLPPDGPRWVPGGAVYVSQTDGRGVKWEICRVEAGGRVLHWQSWDGTRKARTEATPAMAGYPSDADVLAWTRAQRKEMYR